MYSRITGTGSCLPEKVVTNKDLEKIVNTTDQWIVERTGIKKRHIVTNETACDLAEIACKNAMEMAGKTAEDIDLIVLATTTPDLVFPSTACLLQQRIGITNGGAAFDIQAVCTGFVYALATADKFIKSGSNKCALVIGAETLSKPSFDFFLLFPSLFIRYIAPNARIGIATSAIYIKAIYFLTKLKQKIYLII